MDQQQYEYLIDLLDKTKDSKDIPVSAIVVDKENKIVGVGYNTREKNLDISAHAEVNAINDAMRKLKTKNLSDYKIMTTLDPCTMCYSAAKQAKVPLIEFLLLNPQNDSTRSLSLHDRGIKLVQVGSKQQREEYRKIIKDFFENNVRK